MDEFSPSISPGNLFGRVGCAAAPLILDGRGVDDFVTTAMIVGPIRAP